MHLRKQTSDLLKICGIIILGIIILGALITFHNKREEKFNIAMEQYESCIKEQYETTPAEYYYHHNVYPKCN